MNSTPVPTQYGLIWEPEVFGNLSPRWSAEPSISQIKALCRQHLHLDPEEPCTATLHERGGTSIVYTIEALARSPGRWIIKVCLPVDPGRKTRSEVATMQFVKERTKIPVPGVLACDVSNQNSLGFEWNLMDFMPGTELTNVWLGLEFQQKAEVVRQLARYQAELLLLPFDSHMIGSLYPFSQSDNSSGPGTSPYIGPVASHRFSWGPTLSGQQDSNARRGPFKNSHNWLAARLQLIIDHPLEPRSKGTPPADAASQAPSLAHRLLALLPSLFDPEKCGEEIVLHHADLHEGNILISTSERKSTSATEPTIDSDPVITALIDWEHQILSPFWHAISPPCLFDGKVRLSPPLASDYPPEPSSGDGSDNPDNLGKPYAFWQHTQEYEHGLLRSIWEEGMKSHLGEEVWKRVWTSEEARRKSDFELAIWVADGPAEGRRVAIVEEWIGRWERSGWTDGKGLWEELYVVS
ncbi:uncharacterized protein MYCGRDRAFT_75353 [Zymoseptoria tritici IPO323]|uniref:Aminoglycoside phosphotransferase domain-containing protein n=1 Tax=Zymoseptoria tritici (strain CBS 115943 / IPO323) TaxID=336722 RepID=F9XJ53_ZYMTI|nr:uncharacterized protein MYCGRDRAFT_75353 [Zymoseptoria tritici IPO323]EGP84287.1 hypothetical protein MYCGRDRAFT_75353 [Zymoseptoria tritici IPO323]